VLVEGVEADRREAVPENGMTKTDPIKAALDDVLSSLPSDDSRRAYEGDWTRFALWLGLEDVDVRDARPKHVQRYLAHLRNEGKAKATIGRALSVIREVYAAFVRDEIIETNPAREVKKPKMSANPSTPHLNEEQMRAMLAVPAATWMERRDRLCIGLLFGLGWRRREVACLTIEDFRAGTVTGILKGQKEHTVGVPLWLLEMIEEWSEYAEINSGPLLPRTKNKPTAIGPSTVYKIVARIGALARVPEELTTPHALRRTNITLGGERGVSLKARQLAVGHSSQATTERYDRARDASKNAPGQVFADLVPKKTESGT
jgi:integrase/recombinase XerD